MKTFFGILFFNLLFSFTAINAQVNSCTSDLQCESCITSDFCKFEQVTECKVYKTGMDSSGRATCSLRCPSTLKSGKCLDHICHSPENIPIPDFDPNNCSNAI